MDPETRATSSTVVVKNSELSSRHVLVGDADGRCAVYSDARPSAFGSGLVSVHTEHGTLLLDPDGSSIVEA